MEARYRVVFAGRIQAGLDLALVKQEAGTRLRASPEQLDQLFSLPRVILKKDVDGAYAHAYVAALREIGMLVELEPLPQQEIPPAQLESPPSPRISSAPPPEPRTESTPVTHMVPPAGARTGTPASAPVEENVIIQDSPAPLAVTTAGAEQTGSDLANTLAPLDTAHAPPAPEAAPANPLTSSYERMQANLARAEAVLNASRRPAEPLAAVPEPPVFTRAAEAAPTAAPAAPVASSLTVSLDTTAAPAPSPAEPLQPLPAKAPLLFRTTIECSECGTPHIIEGRLMVTVLPSPGVEPQVKN